MAQNRSIFSLADTNLGFFSVENQENSNLSSNSIVDWLMYRSYETQRNLGVAPEKLKPWFDDAEAFEECYQEAKEKKNV